MKGNSALGALSCIVLTLFVGCATVPTPKNATLRTGDGPLIQAHRGGRFEYEDNAAGGFVRSLKRGIRGFETDVRLTKDHELVVMHDKSANRTTDGAGIVEELTLAELKKFRLQACSEPVPTPVEVFGALQRRDDVFIEIEMKAGPSAFYTPEVLTEYCRKLNNAAAATLAPGTYAFTSFHTNTLATMRAVDASAPIGYITGGALTDEHIATAKRLGCCSVAPTLKTSAEMVAKAHAAGLTVCLWMVQNAAQYIEAKAKGADRVTSDYPHLLDCAVRGSRKKLVALDLDATLCQHRSPIPEKNLAALKALEKKYKCIMVGAGNAPRIYRQMENCPIDIVGSTDNKYDATLDWAKAHGYTLDDIVFLGDDFADGGGDSHVRIKDMDHIVIKDYKKFAGAVGVLLKEAGCDNLIAHRGESVDAPENTLPAYKTAVDRGFGFECDIYLSKDKKLFTFHDSNLRRTTGGANTNRCTDVDWEKTVSKVNVGGWGKWKDSAFDPTRPALLSEVLDLARDGRWIYVEVKGNDPAWVPYIKAEFAKAKKANPQNVLFISFSDKVCAELKRQMPEYRVYWLTESTKKGPDGKKTAHAPAAIIAKLRAIGADGVDISYNPKVVDAAYVKAIKDAGFSFHVWTVDKPELARKAFAAGTETLTTNRAKYICEALVHGK